MSSLSRNRTRISPTPVKGLGDGPAKGKVLVGLGVPGLGAADQRLGHVVDGSYPGDPLRTSTGRRSRSTVSGASVMLAMALTLDFVALLGTRSSSSLTMIWRAVAVPAMSDLFVLDPDQPLTRTKAVLERLDLTRPIDRSLIEE
jgi:hypothetical protein